MRLESARALKQQMKRETTAAASEAPEAVTMRAAEAMPAVAIGIAPTGSKDFRDGASLVQRLVGRVERSRHERRYSSIADKFIHASYALARFSGVMLANVRAANRHLIGTHIHNRDRG